MIRIRLMAGMRVLPGLLFVYSGIEKLFLPFDAGQFTEHYQVKQDFITFYMQLQRTGYLYFVGFFQLLCGALLLFRRTHLSGAVMLIPLLFCLLATHVFISKDMGWLLYDCLMLILTVTLIIPHYKKLRQIFLPALKK